MVRAMLRRAFVPLLLVAAACRSGIHPVPCLVLPVDMAAGDMGPSDMGPSDMGPPAHCFLPPTATAARTACGDITRACDPSGKSAPNLACLDLPPADMAGGGVGAQLVTLAGAVRPFQDGPVALGAAVAVYDATQLSTGADPASLAPLAQTHADLLGVFSGGDRPATYALNGVPLNRQLVIRASSPSGVSDTLWTTTIEWGVILLTSDRACDPAVTDDHDCLESQNGKPTRYRRAVSLMAASDWARLPVAAGLPGGTRAGQGVVLGEVRDCDGVRLANVQVAVTPVPDRFAYFGGSDAHLQPDPRLATSGTSRLGAFAAFAVAPGSVTVETAGALVGVPLTSFGHQPLFVYPNTVSLVTINGGRAVH
jgi:hypothetical protein